MSDHDSLDDPLDDPLDDHGRRDRPPAPLRARGPADLLALVPRLLGFHPEQSVVLLTVGDARTPFHARVDLPADPVAAEELSGHLARVAAQNGVTRAAVVVYTDDAGAAELLAEQLGDRLTARAVEVVCRIRADGRRWWDLEDPCSGYDDVGQAYDVRSHPFMAQAVVEGDVVLPSRQALADTLVGDDPDEVERVAALAGDAVDRLAAADRSGPAAARRLDLEAVWVRRRVGRFVAAGERLDSHDVARLATLTTVQVPLRDVAWAEISRVDAARHVDLWRDVVRRVPAELRAAPAALLAFAAWLAGDGALAWCAVDRSLQADPGYGLATLVARALEGAVPPTAWTPPPRHLLPPFAG